MTFIENNSNKGQLLCLREKGEFVYGNSLLSKLRLNLK